MKFVAGWYLIYTRPRHERKVASHLEENNIPFFLPETRVTKKWYDRTKIINVPLFPSYVFVLINKVEDYFTSLQCESVTAYVRFGKEIARVKDETINNLKMVVGSGNNVEVSCEQFRPGQELLIQRGVFAGLKCEVVEHQSRKKILVRINLLNRSVLADISYNLVAI